jgi:hypothetical protein
MCIDMGYRVGWVLRDGSMVAAWHGGQYMAVQWKKYAL